MRSHLKIALLIAALMFVATCYAEKIKTYWSGTSMSAAGPRTVTLTLAGDGTAVLAQTKGDESTKQHATWRKDGKMIVLTFDPTPDGKTASPMQFELKKNTLIPQMANNAELGAFAYPTLQPFGAETVDAGASSNNCAHGTTGPCANRQTWNSKVPAK